MMNSIEIANNLEDIEKIYAKWVKAGKKTSWLIVGGGSYAGLEIDYKNKPSGGYPYYYSFDTDTDEYRGRYTPELIGAIK